MMSQVRVFVAVQLFSVLMLVASGNAQSKGPDGVGFYRSLESQARDDYEKSVASLNIEKEKRVRAGKVIVTPAMERDAISGVRLLMYNKYASAGICADTVMTER